MARITTPCVTCKRQTRPNGTKVADYPGTRMAVARGMCSTCYQRARREERGTELPVLQSSRQADYQEIPCVLVRVDLTPSSFKTLNAAKLDIAVELSKLADQLAQEVRRAGHEGR